MGTRKQEIKSELEVLLQESNGIITLQRSKEIDAIKLKLEQELAQIDENEANEQAKQLRVQTETKEIEYILDNLSYEDVSMRELFADEQRYQFGRIAIQTKMIEVVEKFTAEIALIQLQHKEFERAAEDRDRAGADRELQLQRQNSDLQGTVWSYSEDVGRLNDEIEKKDEQINTITLAVKDAESKRDAAVVKADGLELLVSEKQAQIDILRQEAAVGARNAPQVVNMETQRQQMQALAEQIKADRIRIYDVVPDNEINPKNYTAKRLDNGQEVTYNWTQERNYIVEKDEALVSQFRAQHSQKSVLPDSPLVFTDLLKVDVPTISDEQFRPSVGIVQEEQAVSQENTGDADIRGHAEGVSGAAVTAAQLEQRLQQFAQEHGLVKQAVA